MSDINALIAEAELGEEARKFLDSQLGKCVLGIAEQQVMLAEKALGKTDPDDKKKIVALQQRIELYEKFPTWLAELLHDGENAISIYKQEKQ